MLHFSSLKPFSDQLAHGITQAHEGDFNDKDPDFQQNLKNFVQKQGLPTSPRYLKQIHSKTISVETLHCNVSTQTPLKEGDALITNEPNIPLMVKTADCQPVIIYAPDVNALGVVHSGWRGSVQNIIGETIQKMMNEYQADPKQMKVGIGPSLGPCCSEFTDPKTELPEFCHPFIQGRQVDFWKLSLQQCEQANVPIEQVELIKHCTKHQPGYFSYRRGEAKRFGTWAMLK